MINVQALDFEEVYASICGIKFWKILVKSSVLKFYRKFS